MAYNETVRGAIHSQCLPFPLSESRPSATFTNYARLLGRVFDLPGNLQAILVKAGAAQTSAAKLCYKWSDAEAKTVVITASTGDKLCGVVHPSMGDIASGDYFFLLRPGNGGGGAKITVVDSGAGVTAADAVQATAGGKVLTDAAFEQDVSLGYAEDTVAASGDINVTIFGSWQGANA